MTTNRTLWRTLMGAVLALSAVFTLAACGGGDTGDPEAGTMLRDRGVQMRDGGQTMMDDGTWATDSSQPAQTASALTRSPWIRPEASAAGCGKSAAENRAAPRWLGAGRGRG